MSKALLFPSQQWFEALAGQKPILGVCLGHQAVASSLGGQVVRSTRMMHGKTSPVYHDGHLYWFHEQRGIAYCLNAKTGETVFEERINPPPRTVYSSAIVADGKIYNISQHNGAYVLAAKPEFEMLAHNTFEDDNSRTNACIVVSNGQLLLRNDRNLYCIGQK